MTAALPGASNQFIYDLTAEDPAALKILDVLLQSAGTNIPLTFDDSTETEHLFFRLRQPVATGETLLIR